MSEEAERRVQHCSAIRDQGACGSCTAFAVNGIWECVLRLEAENVDLLIDLSEQHLFGCSGGTCSRGNSMEAPLDRALIGVALEEDCPYRTEDVPCGTFVSSDWWKRGKRLGRWEALESKEVIIETLQKVPLVGAMPVYTSFFNYVSGVYQHLPSDQLEGYHAIGVLYYDLVEITEYDETLDAFLCRNSWGENWGMQGYFWIKSDELMLPMFYIETTDEPVEEDSAKPGCTRAQTVWRIPLVGKRLVQTYRYLRFHVKRVMK